MSRGWSRGRGQSVSLPLETLFKESANRPSALRSAGTVGKWGITSFTSIRSTPHSAVSSGVLNAFGNQKHSKFDYNSSLKRNQNNCFESSNDLLQNTNTANIQSVKPKKFFKSRNAVVALDSNSTDINKVSSNNKFLNSPSKNVDNPPKKSINKAKLNRQEIPKLKISLDKSKYTKHKLFSAKNLKDDKRLQINVNSKYVSRNKGKIINYSEENSCSPPTSPCREQNIQQSESSPISPKRQLDHPPIVLRISKGTSRLISTDSESGVVSPQHSTSCTSPQILDPIEPLNSPPYPQESIKLTIRTRDTKICSKSHSSSSKTESSTSFVVKDKHSNVTSVENAGESSRAARASRRNQQKNKAQEKDEALPELEKNLIAIRRKSSPQPGSENYDLYCTLASPVENKEDKLDTTSESIKNKTSTEYCKADENAVGRSELETDEHDEQKFDSGELICSSSDTFSQNYSSSVRQIGQKYKGSNKSSYDDLVCPSKFKSDLGSHEGLLNSLETESLKQGSSNAEINKLNNCTQNIEEKHHLSYISQWFVENDHLNPKTKILEDKSDTSTDVGQNDVNTETNNLDETQPSVKLVISKKKGSIFKSRALVNDGTNSNGKKRHVYRHKCWQFDEQKASTTNEENAPATSFDFDDADGTLTRVSRAQPNVDNSDSEPVMSVLCPKDAKGYYTVVRNVKKAHQIQEIGEEQELNDDVEYILDALQDNNPMSTRCLSAITLASKCMTPAFRMHVRAHNTVTKFFRALHDATKDQSLGLCTATVMFVLSQDQLNMDADRNSLELMLNLLESDVSHQHALDDCGLSLAQLHKNKQKVRELCEEIKSQGKAVHLNLDNITVGQLAMETLLSMTSKRAGEWFKEELRQLGGIEHIVKTVCECCRQVTEYITEWTDVLLDKLRKIERCLRVLENVTQLNEENQTYLLNYGKGIAIDTLVQLYQLCDTKIPLYPTITDDKDSIGVVFRETLFPTLKVLINLTHSFNTKSIGSSIIGQKSGVIDTSLHLLLEVQHHIPHQKNFELSILALLLLINLVQYNTSNKLYLINARAPVGTASAYNQGKTAILALMEYFYQREQLARLEEQTTDAILDGKKDGTDDAESNKQKTNEEFIEETVSKLLQKAGSHMEHTMVASYVVLLLGYVITDCPEHERVLTSLLPNHSYNTMIQVLTKYYKFMNLTGSGDTSIVNHIAQTGVVLKYLEQLEKTLRQEGNTTATTFVDANSVTIKDNNKYLN